LTYKHDRFSRQRKQFPPTEHTWRTCSYQVSCKSQDKQWKAAQLWQRDRATP